MSFSLKVKKWLIGRALEKCKDPFEEGKIVVLFNFSIFMFISNLPYTFITWNNGFVGHFISALVQDFSMLAVIILLNRGYKLELARALFLTNFFLQNVYHLLINNGGGEVIEQAVLFTTLIVLFAFMLYGRALGWTMFVMMALQIWFGIYNYNTNHSLLDIPAEYQDPMMTGDLGYMLVLPLAMNIYLVSEFVKAQEKAKRRIYEQNSLLSEKNQEITDSINYARKIQEAILPSEESVKAQLNDCFLLYLPKDIVAGDFYFLESSGDRTFFGVADCTGHGVPGAMLSVLCSNSLRQSIKEFGLHAPSAILDKTRETVKADLSASASEMKDGMDISFVCFDRNSKSVQWSGANNPLWIIRDKKIIEYKGDKQPVGIHHREIPFTSNTINLQSGDVVYMFTDGYKDQFGGAKQKKYTGRRFKELLLRIHTRSAADQKAALLTELHSWKGNTEQVDDICVTGIRIA